MELTFGIQIPLDALKTQIKLHSKLALQIQKLEEKIA